jgi:hypothetical protein
LTWNINKNEMSTILTINPHVIKNLCQK